MSEHGHFILPFHERYILVSSKLKVFAEDKLKLDEHGGKFSKQVENTVFNRLELQVISWRSVTNCVSWLSHTRTNTTFLSKATDYFSHMLLQR